MGKVIAGMTVSLDGFVNGPDGSVDGLYSDFDELHDIPSFKEMIANTGAVVMGRHVYDMADPFEWANDDYEFQTPIFVVTHIPPEKHPQGNGKLRFIFVTDGVTSAIAQAKQVAGDMDVQVLGAKTVQQCLNAGECDELQIDIMPVLLGTGVKLFENIETENLMLTRTNVDQPTKMRTTLTYAISKRSS